jgi:hypothetical protein
MSLQLMTNTNPAHANSEHTLKLDDTSPLLYDDMSLVARLLATFKINSNHPHR